MTRLETIKKAIADLAVEFSAEDFTELRVFLDELEADLWDAQIERDATAGKLDKLEAQALADSAGPACLNRFSAFVSGTSAGVRLPSGLAAG